MLSAASPFELEPHNLYRLPPLMNLVHNSLGNSTPPNSCLVLLLKVNLSTTSILTTGRVNSATVRSYFSFLWLYSLLTPQPQASPTVTSLPRHHFQIFQTLMETLENPPEHSATFLPDVKISSTGPFSITFLLILILITSIPNFLQFSQSYSCCFPCQCLKPVFWRECPFRNLEVPELHGWSGTVAVGWQGWLHRFNQLFRGKLLAVAANMIGRKVVGEGGEGSGGESCRRGRWMSREWAWGYKSHNHIGISGMRRRIWWW